MSRTPRVSAPVTDSPCQRRRRDRHAVALRLEAEQAAARGGDADRAGAVGAERGGRQARRRPRRPSRRSSRPACAWRSHGLRVAPNASDSVDGQRLELRHVGLAEDHRAGRAQPARRPRRPRAPGRRGRASPCAVTWPATSVSSLIAIGTPLSGGASPRGRASACVGRGERLARRARCGKRVSCGSRRAIRSRYELGRARARRPRPPRIARPGARGRRRRGRRRPRARDPSVRVAA